MTLRPFGPSVTLTALLRVSTPRSIRSRASEEKRTSLADMSLVPSILDQEILFLGGFLLGGDRAFNHAHDVGLLHDQELLAVDLDFRARPLAEQDALAWFEFDGREPAAFIAAAGSDRDHLAFLGLFLDGVGDDDAAHRLSVGVNAANNDAVVQRTKIHGVPLSVQLLRRPGIMP